MAINFRKFFEGVGIRPKATSTADAQGELDVTSGDGKLHYHNGTSSSPVLTEDHEATVTNKNIDAGDNTITNIGEDELADDAVSTTKIQDLAVTDDKIAAGLDTTKIADGSVSNTEFQYLDGVTSSIQTQLDDKANLELSNLAGPTAINQDLTFDKAAPAILTLDSDAGPSESIRISTGDSDDGNAGAIILDPGVGNGNRAETQITSDLRLTTADTAIFLRDVSDTYEYAIRPAEATEDILIILPPDQGATGQALFTDGAGTTYWDNVPASGANTTLSNLDSPTAINQDLLPDTNNTRNLGSFSTKFNSVNSVSTSSTSVTLRDFSLSESASTVLSLLSSYTLPSSVTDTAGLRLFDASSTSTRTALGISTINATGSANSVPVRIETGNVTSGLSGNITLRTGTPTSGIRGDVVLEGARIVIGGGQVLRPAGGSSSIGQAAVTWRNSFINNMKGETVSDLEDDGVLINLNSGEVLFNTVNSLDLSSRLLADSSGTNSLNWTDRTLITSGIAALNWSTRRLSDASGLSSIEWSNRRAFDSTAQDSINWQLRELYDSSGNPTMLWGGSAVSFNGKVLSSLGAPVNANDAATKAYVDASGSNVVHQNTTGNVALNAATTFVTADASSSNITITLQAASELKEVTVKRTDSDVVNYVRVTPASGTIDGASIVYISNQYESITFISDGTNWWVK